MEKGTPEASPSRSEIRGRGYDRDLITAIDDANDTGVVRDVYCRYRLSLIEQTLAAFVWPWRGRQHDRLSQPL